MAISQSSRLCTIELFMNFIAHFFLASQQNSTDSLKDLCFKRFFKNMKELNIDYTILCFCSWKHQFSVKNFFCKELLPHLFQLLTFVKSHKVAQIYSWLFFDLFKFFMSLQKVLSHFFLNAIEMVIFSER